MTLRVRFQHRYKFPAKWKYKYFWYTLEAVDAPDVSIRFYFLFEYLK